MALKDGNPLIPSNGSGVDATKKKNIYPTVSLQLEHKDLLAESEDMDDTPELGLSCMIPVM